MKPEDLLSACGITAEGQKIFDKVVVLALETRRQLTSLAERAVSAPLNELEALDLESKEIVRQFDYARNEILSRVSDKAFQIGLQVSLDDLCNSKV